MPWEIERDGSAVRVQITLPTAGEWEQLLDAVQAALADEPKAVYLPSRIEGGSQTDADLLKVLWAALGASGVPILPP